MSSSSYCGSAHNFTVGNCGIGLFRSAFRTVCAAHVSLLGVKRTLCWAKEIVSAIKRTAKAETLRQYEVREKLRPSFLLSRCDGDGIALRLHNANSASQRYFYSLQLQLVLPATSRPFQRIRSSNLVPLTARIASTYAQDFPPPPPTAGTQQTTPTVPLVVGNCEGDLKICLLVCQTNPRG